MQTDDLRKPILPGKGASDYERYLRTDELLALQKGPDELSHKDELTFQVVHQSSELLLKGAAFELERALGHIEQSDYANAARLIRRANMMLDYPVSLLHVRPRIGVVFHEQLKRADLSVDELYQRHAEYFGLHDVAECMLDFDERVQIFRFHHLKLAQRIIGGGVVGTMGTPVEVLHQRQEHVLYKELWDVRNQITARANESLQNEGKI